MAGEFAGKSVIVTGAGRGIGRGVAEAFAAAGARVLLGARTRAYAEDAAAAIRAAGGTADVFELDVKDRSACRALVEAAVSRFGGVDIIIHSAAEIPHGGLGAVSDRAIDAAFTSIAKAAWWLLEAARPHLACAVDGGRFIAIGSVNGPVTMVPGMTAYGMAKSALDAFIRGAALDVVEESITVNSIVPGFIASARALDVLGADGAEAYGKTIPVGRAGTSEDIAHAAFFLASPRASYVTGTSIKVDGGSTITTASRSGFLADKLKLQHEEMGDSR